MNNLFEYKALGNYKKQLFECICNNEKTDMLIDVIMPCLDDNRINKIDNFLGGEQEINTSSGKEIVKLQGHLYDVPFIYTTVTNAINCICIDTNIANNSISTKTMSVTIYIMCHKSNLNISDDEKSIYRKSGYVGNRLDIAVAILGDMLNHSKDFGIGRLTPLPRTPVRPYFPNDNYFGKILEYTCSDFMLDYSNI